MAEGETVEEFKERIRSIGSLSGTKKERESSTQKVAVKDERDGTVGGFHTQHWDGSQDATIMHKPPHFKLGMEVQ